MGGDGAAAGFNDQEAGGDLSQIVKHFTALREFLSGRPQQELPVGPLGGKGGGRRKKKKRRRKNRVLASNAVLENESS